MRLTQSIFAALLFLAPCGVLAEAAVAVAQASSSAPAAASRGSLGAIAQDISCQQVHPLTGQTIAQTVEIVDVATDGAAFRKGLRRGDYLIGINGQPISRCADIAPIIGKIPQDGSIRLEVLRAGQLVLVEAPLKDYLAQKPTNDTGLAAKTASAAVSRQQATKPVQLTDEQRAAIAAMTRAIKAQLAGAPEHTVPRAIIKDMQAIRNIFRDSDSGREGWMKGTAGAATIQFKKGEHIIILKGMNNELYLEVYRLDGVLVHAAQMDTLEQRRQLPTKVLSLLQSL